MLRARRPPTQEEQGDNHDQEDEKGLARFHAGLGRLLAAISGGPLCRGATRPLARDFADCQPPFFSCRSLSMRSRSASIRA